MHGDVEQILPPLYIPVVSEICALRRDQVGALPYARHCAIVPPTPSISLPYRYIKKISMEDFGTTIFNIGLPFAGLAQGKQNNIASNETNQATYMQ